MESLRVRREAMYTYAETSQLIALEWKAKFELLPEIILSISGIGSQEARDIQLGLPHSHDKPS